MRHNQAGFTLLELLIVVVILVIVVAAAVLLISFCVGNLCFTEAGVLQAINVDHPEAVRVLATDRYVFKPSMITVENKDGSRAVYDLESNIFFNYHIKPHKK